MNNFSLRQFLFGDRSGEDAGKRAEVITTLLIGFVVTGVWAFTYRNPIVIFLAALTCLSALFTIIQTVREKNGYPTLFPSLAMGSVIAVAVLEGKGFQDLIWMSSFGIFLLVNIYSASKNKFAVYAIAVFMVGAFAGVGLLEVNKILPNPLNTDMNYVLVNSSIMLGIMGVIMAVFHRHRFTIQLARNYQLKQISSRQQVEDLNHTLESQIQRRTSDLQDANLQLQTRAAKLQATSEISQELTVNPNETPADLLMRTTRLISEKLGYYHVGIFIVDSLRGSAVLRASNSAGGQQMLEKGHQLKIGGAGVVGYVSQSGRARIALDAGADAVYFNNPYLPETRSEISLPIKFTNSVIGVLDVQSTQSGAFNDEDTNILMTLANQLAALLYAKEGKALVANTPEFGRQINRPSTWKKQMGYSFRPDGSTTMNAEPEQNPALDKVIASGEPMVVFRSTKDSKPTLAVPVKFRDQIVGVIHIESAEANRNWTEDEISLVQAISERAAVALENARLFENATRRAEQEETISRVTTQIGSSTDFERIMQTTIQELGLALGASRSFIQIGASMMPDQKVSK
ncbi:hypothetical protein MASR2M66_08130 [Chloroflexota bacterium]